MGDQADDVAVAHGLFFQVEHRDVHTFQEVVEFPVVLDTADIEDAQRLPGPSQTLFDKPAEEMETGAPMIP